MRTTAGATRILEAPCWNSSPKGYYRRGRGTDPAPFQDKELKEQIDAMRPGIKTLFMSGYTANAISRRGILEKDVAFLQKPFSMTSLAAKIRLVLDSRKSYGTAG